MRRAEGEPDLLYIDLHLVHEVTSPQAFDGLRLAGRPVRRPDLTLATEDHNVPTLDIDQPIADPVSRTQVETLRRNCAEFGVPLHPLGDARAGHRARHRPAARADPAGHDGRLRRLAHLDPRRVRRARLRHRHQRGRARPRHPDAAAARRSGRWRSPSTASCAPGVTAKDVILAVIAEIGTGGGQGYVIEYRGSAIRALSMEARMTVCNMSIEAGARAGMIAPDETTFAYLEGRPRAPQGRRLGRGRRRLARRCAPTTTRCSTTRSSSTRRSLAPFVTWGTNPARALPLLGVGARPRDLRRRARARGRRSGRWSTWGSTAGTPLRDIAVDTVFLGSCTNGRIEDLRAAAEVLRGRQVADGVRMLVVPGSVRVRLAAEDEGLDEVFKEAGAEWRHAGCSMCLGMNPDQLAPGERSASTSNRNFEGRQGKGGRTHLVSPLVAAATAVTGRLSSPADLLDDGAVLSLHGRRHRPTPARAVALRRSNVDTDQIIPAVYLKRVTRTGFEDGLFAAWRNDPDFVLNRPEARGRDGAGRRAGLRHRLVARARRLGAAGLRLPGRRLLALRRHLPRQRRQGRPASRPQVGQPDVERLWAAVEADPATEVTVDLGSRTVSWTTAAGEQSPPSTSTTTPAGG